MRRRCQLVSLATFTFFLSLGAPQFPTFSFLPAAAQTTQNRKAEADRLFQQGIQQYQISQFTTALQFWQQALVLYREIKDRQGEGQTLGGLGAAYSAQGNYGKAIEYQEQNLAITRELKDRQGEGVALGNLGIAYHSLSNYGKAIEYQEQNLAIARELKDRLGEGRSLNGLGIAYSAQGNYGKAIEYQEQNLAIAREIKDRQGEGNALGNLGTDYKALGNYYKAIEFHQQSLAIWREIGNRRREGAVLANLGNVYSALGNYGKAIEFHQQRLAIARKLKDREGEGQSLGNLGSAYSAFRNYDKAIELQEQSLAIAREIKDRLGEGQSLNGLGGAYLALGNYGKAIEFHQQSLAIAREIKDRQGEGAIWGNLGLAYLGLGSHGKAIEFHQQSLAIAREIKDRQGEGLTLSNLGRLVAKQQPELAIVFYKQSVNVREGIRTGIRTLDRALQESYTQSVAGTYRSLADLLIRQGRIVEAQQVLELLKVQELNDLDPAQRTNPTRLAELALNPLEQEIQTKHNNLIAFGIKVRTCEQNCQPLEAQQSRLYDEFKIYLANIKAALEKAQLNGDLFRINDRNKDFIASASKIVNAQPGTVLIYPLVLPDKIHLLWASQGGILSSTTCPMGESQLNTTITAFQRALTDRTDLAGVKQHGKLLYDCLIKPLEEKGEWDKNKIQNLVIAADRTINYIPIGALYNGKQFLVERYTISNIINAGLTDVATKLPANPTILGLGISDSLDGLPSLPNVRAELNTIIRSTASPAGLYPGSLNLNQTATLARFKSQLAQNPYNIVHIATHGQFNPTKPDESFLLFSSGKPGIGDHLTINRIEQQDDLRKVHLVVLSACQTASGQSSTSGIEIQGLSAAFVRDRAKAVIASLWSVNDASTTVLMQQFYKNLAQGLTKSEALRQAQLSLLNDKTPPKTKDDRSVVQPETPNQPTRQDQLSPGYTHPYYWAPFILIGNGL